MEKGNTMYVLGLNESHNATAVLLKGGKVLGAVSEERFTREKNQAGFPKKAVRWLLAQAKITPKQLDLVATHGKVSMFSVIEYLATEKENQRKASFSLLSKGKAAFNKLQYRYPALRPLDEKLVNWAMMPSYKKSVEKRREIIGKELGISSERILFVDHHTAHAYTACWNSGREASIVTIDADGDLKSSTIGQWREGKYRLIAESSRRNSLGHFYTFITQWLGLKPLEHEYKVMGMAPYANEYYIDQIWPIFKDLITIEGLQIKSKVPANLMFLYLQEHLQQKRFDAICGAAQRLLEKNVVKLVQNTVRETGIRKVGAAGGTFMNTKANLKVLQLPEVEDLFVFPSAGDESLAFGAAYYGYEMLCKQQKQETNIEPIKELYLGPSYSNSEVKKMLDSKKIKKKYAIEKPASIEKTVARLLAAGNTVARIAGKMEFGARALGNRSIMASPESMEVVRKINEQIKNRDFWMPFAPSILKEREHDYCINPKGMKAPYMMICFDSTELAKKELKAAMHPYDSTIRPQIVEKEWNQGYWKTIKEFEKKTGIGGILNTSFNIHGEPIVCSPEDAIHTLESSGLEYLQIENYLISK